MADYTIDIGEYGIPASVLRRYKDAGDGTHAPAVYPIGPADLTMVSGTANTSGDNQVVAAPGAGYRLVVSAFVLQNESQAATTMILRDGTTAGPRFFAASLGANLPFAFPAGRDWKLSANAALNLNLSGNNACGYTVHYWIEAVG